MKLRNLSGTSVHGQQWESYKIQDILLSFCVYNYTHMHAKSIQKHKCTKILEVNLFAFANRLFHEDFSSIDGTFHEEKSS